jgi:hypothetical protein
VHRLYRGQCPTLRADVAQAPAQFHRCVPRLEPQSKDRCTTLQTGACIASRPRAVSRISVRGSFPRSSIHRKLCIRLSITSPTGTGRYDTRFHSTKLKYCMTARWFMLAERVGLSSVICFLPVRYAYGAILSTRKGQSRPIIIGKVFIPVRRYAAIGVRAANDKPSCEAYTAPFRA